MQKKHIRWITILAFFIIGITFGYQLTRKVKEKDKLEEVQQSLSIERIEFLGDTLITENDQIIFTLFHPSCYFCQTDAKQFRKSYVQLKDFEVLWVSYDEKDSIQKFSRTYGLDSLPNMHFAYMDIEALLERYGNVKFPTFLAYDKQGHLLKRFVGLTKPEEILKVYQME